MERRRPSRIPPGSVTSSKSSGLSTVPTRWRSTTRSSMSPSPFRPLDSMVSRITRRPDGISIAVRSWRRTSEMLYYALMFLVVGLIAGALGLFGIAAIAGQIAWVLFLVGVVLIIVHMISGRRALP